MPCPDRPHLQAFDREELVLMAPSTQAKIGRNQIELKAYAEKLELRARCGN